MCFSFENPGTLIPWFGCGLGAPAKKHCGYCRMRSHLRLYHVDLPAIQLAHEIETTHQTIQPPTRFMFTFLRPRAIKSPSGWIPGFHCFVGFLRTNPLRPGLEEHTERRVQRLLGPQWDTSGIDGSHGEP